MPEAALIIAVMALMMSTAALAVQLTLLLHKDKTQKAAPLAEEDHALDAPSEAEVEAFFNSNPALKQNQKEVEKLEEALVNGPFNGIDEDFGL